MRNFTIIVLIFCIQSCIKQKTEFVLLGTVHSPTENFNADSLYNIFDKIKPDVILYEVDSSFFTDDFHFKNKLKGNEYLATTRYMENHQVIVRPYDFTGRNEYRIEIGSRPTDGKALKMLDSLFQTKQLGKECSDIYEQYKEINESLNNLA